MTKIQFVVQEEVDSHFQHPKGLETCLDQSDWQEKGQDMAHLEQNNQDPNACDPEYRSKETVPEGKRPWVALSVKERQSHLTSTPSGLETLTMAPLLGKES